MKIRFDREEYEHAPGAWRWNVNGNYMQWIKNNGGTTSYVKHVVAWLKKVLNEDTV